MEAASRGERARVSEKETRRSALQRKRGKGAALEGEKVGSRVDR